LRRSLIVLAGFVFVLTLGTAAPAAGQNATASPSPVATPAQTVQPIDKNQKTFTAEQIVESAIFVYGSRPILNQIRRNGIERGRVCKPNCEVPSKTEEATYERRFVRGDNSEKDKVRVDQKMPTLEYSLIYGEGKLWGIINGTAFTPRQDAASVFLSQQRHSIDSLLRYKENGSTLTYVGKDKQKGIDLYIVDIVGKDKQKTRYFISAKTLHVVWLEYEEAGGTQKFRRSFHDYRYAQSTLVPYRSVLLEDGKQTQETRIFYVTYGTKLDDSLFKAPEA